MGSIAWVHTALRGSVFTVLALLALSSHAATITQWTFDSNPSDASTSTGTEIPAVGSGTFLLIGGATATYATGNGGGADNSGRNTATYPAQGTGDKTRGVEFAVSTVGFNAINLAFDLRHSNTSANTVVVQYSADGSTFTDFTTFVANAGDAWFSRNVDLSSVAGLNNNANAKFRVLSTFAAGGSVYVASTPGSSYGSTGGTMRYDNVIVSGTAISGGDVPPTVTSVTPANAATNVPVNTGITLNFSEAVNVAAGGVTLVCGSPGTAIALNTLPANAVTSLALTPASELPSSSSCTVTTVAANVVDIDGTPNAMASDFIWSFTTAAVIIGNTPPTIAPTVGGNPRLSLATTSPGFASGVISDPTDPVSVTGVSFTVADAETPVASVTVSATSSNAAVVPNANIVLSGSGATRNVKITPIASGVAMITVTVSDGTLSTDYVINYAASIASVSPANSRFITGACDASSATAIDANALFVANDEDQQLRLYPRGVSGFNATLFDFTTSLALTDLSGGLPREVDLEASTRIGNRIYWMGSHSNSSGGSARPNRSRLYATDVSGAGIAATLAFVGYYENLKTDLIAWDSGNVHGLGANAFGFAASAAAGVLPDANDGSGFNIEALTIAPDGATAYLAFRGPLATATTRNRALIVPVTNFAALIGGAGPATFGAPIQLDLGGRAIRSIERNAANQYLILAGPTGAATGIAPADFRLFKWTGLAANTPELFTTDLTARGVVGSFEGIVEVPNPLQAGARVELLVDTGDTNFYGTGACKDLPNAEHKKARIETFELTSPATRIHAIQGSGAASPLAGQTVTIEGIVTADFEDANQLGGFYVQEPDALKDSDPLTSEGIFVASATTSVAVGDLVKVSGVVSETFGLTQIGGATLSVSVISSGNPLPAIVDIALPAAAASNNAADWERYEGMRVRFAQTLTVTENFNLARFGELVLADGRQIQPTNVVDPNDNPSAGNNTNGNSNVANVTAAQLQNTLNRILLDDASNVQNPATIPYWDAANNTLRVGTTTAGVTGIMSYGFNTYRIQPTIAPIFNFAARPTMPPAVGAANVKVASFNVLNYFNGNGAGGGFPTARGATTAAEFVRQRDKIIAAINTMNADVVGLMEMENDGSGASSAVADLVNGLNLAAGAQTWSYVTDPSNLGNTAGGTDQIKVAIIYKSAQVMTDRATLLCDDPAFANGRTPTAQTFRSAVNNGRFTIVVNHFKSKSASTPPTGADIDQLDGQAAYNASRRAQALALNACVSMWKDTVGDDDFVLLGDFNAYAQEDPIDALRAAGNTVLDESGYSYVFDGQSGALDHTLVSASLLPQVSGAAAWHINADEPRILDYNVEFKNTAGCTSGSPAGSACTSPDNYAPTPFRSSDHDPVLIGLNLTADPVSLSFDIDGSGTCDAVNDPVLMVRFLLGLRDDSLTEGLTTVRTLAQIIDHLVGLGNVLDVDDDGAALALTDGLMFSRYTRQLIGAALTESARNPRLGGGIKSDAEIKKYFDDRCSAAQ
jgi:predicted extracellular nuclease